ncbi:unnamed protein product [Penicillium bialowiezense]
MRFSIFSAATTLLVASTATATHSGAHAARNLDLSQVPILSLVSALVDSLPVNAEVLSCVIDALPVDAGVAVLAPSPSSAAATSASTHAADLDLAKVPVLSILSAIVDKLPVDVSAKVLPGGISDLSKLDFNSIASCVDQAL